jgi:hypothetical protein
MYNRLKRLYDSGRITQTHLEKAVNNGWITLDELEDIVNGNTIEEG